MAKEFTWSGKGGKKAFKNMVELKDLIFEVIHCADRSYTKIKCDSDITYKILKHRNSNQTSKNETTSIAPHQEASAQNCVVNGFNSEAQVCYNNGLNNETVFFQNEPIYEPQNRLCSNMYNGSETLIQRFAISNPQIQSTKNCYIMQPDGKLVRIESANNVNSFQ